MSSRLSGRLISMTSAHRSSPSAPISTSLKTQATHPPSVRERTRTYPTAVAPPISRRSLLRTWKLRPAYCRAVLEHPVRFDLDGNPTEQPVGEDARTMAKTRLETWASKRNQPPPHKTPGGGTTASSTQTLDRRKPAHTVIVPAPSQRRSKS